MDKKSALEKIRSTPKWYWSKDENGEYNPNPVLIQTAQRIEDGRCKPETERKFFERFGMKLEVVERVLVC